MTAATAPDTRFAVADELTCYYDQPAEPSNVHIEARVPGSLDESAVRAAIGAVLSAEPRLRARRAPGTWRRGYHWEFPEAAETDPVQVVRYADEAELAGLRSELLSQSPSLRASPPLRFLLAAGPGGDALILNAHHACFDGLSALRLLHNVAGAYSRLSGDVHHADPVLREDPASTVREDPARTVREDGAGGTRPAVPARIRPGRITRVAGQVDPGSAARLPGYGAYQLAWDGLAAAGRRRPYGGSVNDLLIAAMMIAISRWNTSHGVRSGLIQITMPVGEASQAGADGQWANRSRLTKVTARPRPGLTAADLVGDVATQTRYAKDHPGAQVDIFSRALTAAPVPVAVKQIALRTALRVAGPFVCDSCLISNLGVAAPVHFGAMGQAQIWFSTSAHMPRGLSLGVVTTGNQLRLTFRYRRALFSDAGATAFAALYLGVLDAAAGREVPA